MFKILLVEDNEMNMDMLARRLARHGFDVVPATTAAEAIQSASASPPDLILMDLGLPEMDGWQAIGILRSGTKTREIPIVALTAHALVTDRHRAFESGFDGFATKPVEFQALLQLMQGILDRAPEAKS